MDLLSIQCLHSWSDDPSDLRFVVRARGKSGWGQLHFELVASVKFLTELTTLAAVGAIVAIWLAEGFDGSALTALESESTEDLIAVVWLGKSPLAELTSAFASLWIVLSWDCKPLMPLLPFKLLSPFMEFSRFGSVRAVSRLAAAAAGERDQRDAGDCRASDSYIGTRLPDGPIPPTRRPDHPIRSGAGNWDVVIAALPVVGVPTVTVAPRPWHRITQTR